MPERPKETYKGNVTGKRGQGPADVNRHAWEIVQQAIGEMPKEEPPAKTDAAVARGMKGGPARKAALSPERRKEIAEKAAQARWKKS